MANILSVDQLIEDIRSQIDEENLETISDDDILLQINRAQKHAFSILARHYVDPLLDFKEVSLSSSTAEYPIPEEAFEGRIMGVEIRQSSNTFVPVRRANPLDLTYYESDSKLDTPYYYSVVGQNYRFVPAPTGTYPARIWYAVKPEKLVKSQGRITLDPSSERRILVEGIGDDLTTDDLSSYVNIVDGQSGVVKITMQVKTLGTDFIEFKTSPTRSSVNNKTIENDILNPASGLAIQADDLVCIGGTAIPYIQDPVVNFYHEFATNALLRKLGESTMLDKQIMADFEDFVESTWTNRENTMRIKRRSRNWSRGYRRYYPRSKQ